jgi:hypothetical protein
VGCDSGNHVTATDVQGQKVGYVALLCHFFAVVKADRLS